LRLQKKRKIKVKILTEMLTAQRLQRQNCLPEEVPRRHRAGCKVSVLSVYRNSCFLQQNKKEAAEEEDVTPNGRTSRNDRIYSFPKREQAATTKFTHSQNGNEPQRPDLLIPKDGMEFSYKIIYIANY
jgi:hypothetical protein